MLFASAILNFGVAQLLDTLVELAPAPARDARPSTAARAQVDDHFSAFVFKVQAGMDAAHRDRLAYARVCSGVFERGMVATHADTGRPFATKYAQAVFGRERTVARHRLPRRHHRPGQRRALRVGDTIYDGEPVEYPPIASFAPEHFAVVRAADSGRYKQFRRGIEQLDQEGVVQVLRSELRGDQAPVLAAVGPMQFEVAAARMETEFNAPGAAGRASTTRWRAAPGRRTRPRLNGAARRRGAHPQRRRAAGALPRPVAGPGRRARSTPHLMLEPLVAGRTELRRVWRERHPAPGPDSPAVTVAVARTTPGA